MKVMIASDLHGSYAYAEQVTSIFRRDRYDLLVLLGDIYNHGPRNPMPPQYAPMQVAELLNGIKDKLLVIKGNCDSEVDQMISEFSFVENAVLWQDGKKIFCTHGHVHNRDNMPALHDGDVLVYGHFHTVMCQKESGVTILNPGSVSLPKDGHRAYIAIEDGVASIITLGGDVLHRVEL